MDLILFRKYTINLQIDNEYFKESKKKLSILYYRNNDIIYDKLIRYQDL